MTGKRLREIPVSFYRTEMGVEPVRDWLRDLPDEDRRTIGMDLATVQIGWPVGMPLCRPLGGGLWEVSSSLPSRIARVLGDGAMSGKNQHWGSSLDDFLKEEGIYEAAKAEAVMRVISWQIAEEMRKRGITKTQMAERMKTSRAQVDRILKAKGNVTIETLQRAAELVGRELRLELV